MYYLIQYKCPVNRLHETAHAPSWRVYDQLPSKYPLSAECPLCTRNAIPSDLTVLPHLLTAFPPPSPIIPIISMPATHTKSPTVQFFNVRSKASHHRYWTNVLLFFHFNTEWIKNVQHAIMLDNKSKLINKTSCTPNAVDSSFRETLKPSPLLVTYAHCRSGCLRITPPTTEGRISV